MVGNRFTSTFYKAARCSLAVRRIDGRDPEMSVHAFSRGLASVCPSGALPTFQRPLAGVFCVSWVLGSSAGPATPCHNASVKISTCPGYRTRGRPALPVTGMVSCDPAGVRTRWRQQGKRPTQSFCVGLVGWPDGSALWGGLMVLCVRAPGGRCRRRGAPAHVPGP